MASKVKPRETLQMVISLSVGLRAGEAVGGGPEKHSK